MESGHTPVPRKCGVMRQVTRETFVQSTRSSELENCRGLFADWTATGCSHARQSMGVQNCDGPHAGNQWVSRHLRRGCPDIYGHRWVSRHLSRHQAFTPWVSQASPGTGHLRRGCPKHPGQAFAPQALTSSHARNRWVSRHLRPIGGCPGICGRSAQAKPIGGRSILTRQVARLGMRAACHCTRVRRLLSTTQQWQGAI
jgi:hypothetical protein